MDRVVSAIPCFRYLSWRDTKTAVILFNRNADFTVVLAKIAETGPKHPNFKRDLGKSDESTFRCVFVQPNDTNREISLTLMAFDIPTAPRGRRKQSFSTCRLRGITRKHLDFTLVLSQPPASSTTAPVPR